MRYAHTTKRAGQIGNQTASVIVVEPIFEVMETREIFAGAFGVAITINLDVAQQLRRRPIRFRLIQHPRESESGFEKGPAIESREIHRRRLNSVIDFERERAIGR